jgi:hypothetical protein
MSPCLAPNAMPPFWNKTIEFPNRSSQLSRSPLFGGSRPRNAFTIFARDSMLPFHDRGDFSRRSYLYRGNLRSAAALSASVGSPYLRPSDAGACPTMASVIFSEMPQRSAMARNVCRQA